MTGTASRSGAGAGPGPGEAGVEGKTSAELVKSVYSLVLLTLYVVPLSSPVC